MKLVRIGKIVNTQGLKGDLRIFPSTDYKERFEELEYVYLEGEKNKKFVITKVRYKKNLAIVKFENYDNINDVETFRNREVFTEKLDQDELEEDRFYVEDLIGIKIIDEEKGYIGILKEIIQNPAHDIYLVELESGKEIMIPAVSEYIIDTDINNSVMTVSLIEGFL